MHHILLSLSLLADTHGCIIATIRLFINEVEVSGLDPPVQQVMQMVQVRHLKKKNILLLAVWCVTLWCLIIQHNLATAGNAYGGYVGQ